MPNNRDMLIVDGVKIKTPSTFVWHLQRISAPDAGRTDDGTMHVNEVCKKRKLELAWNGPTPDEAGDIADAFDPEYVDVTYWDTKNKRNETRTFYAGDIDASVKIWTVNQKRYESISFNIIER